MYNLMEFISNYSETQEVYGIEATNFNNNIENTDNFKSFKYKDKLLGNAVVQPTQNQANGILKNVAIAVLLIYLSNFEDHLKYH